MTLFDTQEIQIHVNAVVFSFCRSSGLFACEAVGCDARHDCEAARQSQSIVLPVADDELRVQATDGLQRKEKRFVTLRGHFLFIFFSIRTCRLSDGVKS